MAMFRRNRKDFTRACHTYGIASYLAKAYDGWPENMSAAKCHALALHHGLALLGPDFVCEVCGVCKGHCRKTGGEMCSWCNGTGLTQGAGDAPAFDSQRHQVLIAASRSLLLPGPVEIV